MTAVDLDQLEAIHLATPAGPWHASGTPTKPYGFWYAFNGGQHQVGDGALRPEVVSFILAAHTATPALISEIRTLRAEVERLRADNKKLRTAQKRAAAEYMKRGT